MVLLLYLSSTFTGSGPSTYTFDVEISESPVREIKCKEVDLIAITLWNMKRDPYMRRAYKSYSKKTQLPWLLQALYTEFVSIRVSCSQLDYCMRLTKVSGMARVTHGASWTEPDKRLGGVLWRIIICFAFTANGKNRVKRFDERKKSCFSISIHNSIVPSTRQTHARKKKDLRCHVSLSEWRLFELFKIPKLTQNLFKIPQ